MTNLRQSKFHKPTTLDQFFNCCIPYVGWLKPHFDSTHPSAAYHRQRSQRFSALLPCAPVCQRNAGMLRLSEMKI